MTVREITFGDADPSPSLVLRALEILGLEGRSSLKGPLKRNGKVVGCLVRFHSETDAEMFVQAWTGFLELRRKGGPTLGMAPMYTLPSLPLRVGPSGGEAEVTLAHQSAPTIPEDEK
jgi:hypothetical protein